MPKFIPSITRLPITYKNAIIGTIFSVTEAILFAPPININAATIATITPTITGFIPKAVLNDSPIEFD